MGESVSELRQDLVSGDWILIATGRAKRPHDFLKEKRNPLRQSKSSCPFEMLFPNTLLTYSRIGGTPRDWRVQAIPNKYPALGKGNRSALHPAGPYLWTDGVGFHEIVISRDHHRSLADMDDEEAELVIRAYQDRYLALKDKSYIKYISIFHNHGRGSGATIAHPHSQIIALPVIPSDVSRSVSGSAQYFRAHNTCVHCAVLEYELHKKERLIYQNDEYAVIAPYASHVSFEMRIFPKRHNPYFETIVLKGRRSFANALRVSLTKLAVGLKNPDYNFFLHTAPTIDGKAFRYYHWHLEILPKTAIWGGFDIGTGIEISAIAPEQAAQFLRKIKI